MTPTMKPARLDQDAIITALKGQKLLVPDLTVHFRAWPPAQLHPRHEAVVPLVDAAIDRMAAAHESLLRRKQDDLAAFAGWFYPQASGEDFEALSFMMVWIVCWDDVVDAGEGDLADDFEAAERMRAKVLGVVRGSLGIDGAAPAKEVDAVDAVFQQFGDRLREKAPMQLRRRIYDGFKSYIDSCAVEQKIRLERFIPDYDSYMALRLRTAGCDIFCSLVEYATQDTLPESIASAPETRQLSKQVGTAFAIINDILSIKKELRTSCVINAVAALLTPESTLGDVVGDLNEKLGQAVADFDTAAENLLAHVEGDEAAMGVVRRYTDGCRCVVTGLLAITLRSPRYNLAKFLKEDGSLEIVL